jgi:hypothetical protein
VKSAVTQELIFLSLSGLVGFSFAAGIIILCQICPSVLDYMLICLISTDNFLALDIFFECSCRSWSAFLWRLKLYVSPDCSLRNGTHWERTHTLWVIWKGAIENSEVLAFRTEPAFSDLNLQLLWRLRPDLKFEVMWFVFTNGLLGQIEPAHELKRSCDKLGDEK